MPLVVLCFRDSLYSQNISNPTNHLPTAEQLDFFEREIRPVLIEQCQSCHGEKKQWNNLRLDSREHLLVGGDSGPTIASGNPSDSLLIEAIKQKGELKMPPESKLTPKQIANFELWISQGAPWPESPSPNARRDPRQHWAFQPLKTPQELTQFIAHYTSSSSSTSPSTIATPVDSFILQKLQQQGLKPSKAADRRTLIRRATMDLHGLPPTMEEIIAFENDPSPNAYQRLIERLLESPRYGEQWGRYWLDVARYSDSKGYVYGREERFYIHSHLYRDWVVNAFNSDLPYDKFLLYQLAADQAQPQDPSNLAAMGFLTVGRRFLGVTHDIIDDRIDVVSRGMMGITLSCARCHDHKYDPIPTDDYYALYGVFQNSTEKQFRIDNPSATPNGATSEKLAEFEKELKRRQTVLNDKMQSSRLQARDRVHQRIADYLYAQTELSKFPEEGFDQILTAQDLIPATVRKWRSYLDAQEQSNDRIFAVWRLYRSLEHSQFAAEAPRIAAVIRDMQPNALHPTIKEQFLAPCSNMREVADRYGLILESVRLAATPSGPAAASKGNEQSTDATNVVALKTLSPSDFSELQAVLFANHSPTVVPDESIIGNEQYFDSATCTELWNMQGAVDRLVRESPLDVRLTLALVDRETIVEPVIFRRGNPANRGDFVPRKFLTLSKELGVKPFSSGSGRLELAQAIIHPDNPLTARVWVNRIWQHHFGAGLVRTPSDFGLRAEQPSHPELLDWLATELRQNGWSTKHLHRLIMLSATYQQSSDRTGAADLYELASQLDPDNRLLWRMNVHRLSFEEMRDSMLSISQVLDPSPGGRASELFISGDSHRRRTLYGVVDRQFLPGVHRVFDFANPDLHIAQRSETSIPQQALFALNHPFIAARAKDIASLVKKASGHAPANIEELASTVDSTETDFEIKQLFEAVLLRQPSAAEIDSAKHFLQSTIQDPTAERSRQSLQWEYGYGQYDPQAGTLSSFQPLPHFTGTAWQGSASFPDGKLGWVQLTARGGHPGNDLQHAIVRRWKAAHAGKISLHSKVIHQVNEGDGIRCSILSSRAGKLLSADVHNAVKDLDIAELQVEQGDVIDFVVDIREVLNSDQHFWTIEIQGDPSHPEQSFHSEKDFFGPYTPKLTPWEQLAQVLLLSNELMFVD